MASVMMQAEGRDTSSDSPPVATRNFGLHLDAVASPGDLFDFDVRRNHSTMRISFTRNRGLGWIVASMLAKGLEHFSGQRRIPLFIYGFLRLTGVN